MKRNWRLWLAYLGGSFSIGVFNAFNIYTLPLWLATYTTSYPLLALLGNTRSLGGAVVSPLTGVFSDRIWLGWWGRRRPFILVGGLGSALLMATTPLVAHSLGPAEPTRDLLRLAPIVGAILFYTLVFNTMDDLQKALLPDVTAAGAERNTLSSLSVVVDIGAQVGLLMLGFLIWSGGIPDAAFAVAGGLVALGVLVVVLGVREPAPFAWQEARRQEAGALAREGERLTPGGLLSRYRGALLFFVVTLAYWSGVNAILPLLTRYLQDILGADDGQAQLLPALLLLTTAAMAIPMAWLGTRFGKRRVLAGGYAIMVVGALFGLLITTVEQGAVLLTLAGIGNSAVVVLAIPILADLVPRHHMGVAAGLLAASGAIASPLASLLSGLLAEVYGPRVIFAVMAALTFLGLVLLPTVREPSELAGRDDGAG